MEMSRNVFTGPFVGCPVYVQYDFHVSADEAVSISSENVYTSVTKEMADTAVGIMDAFLAELIAEAKKLATIEEPNGRNGKKRKA